MSARAWKRIGTDAQRLLIWEAQGQICFTRRRTLGIIRDWIGCVNKRKISHERFRDLANRRLGLRHYRGYLIEDFKMFVIDSTKEKNAMANYDRRNMTLCAAKPSLRSPGLNSLTASRQLIRYSRADEEELWRAMDTMLGIWIDRSGLDLVGNGSGNKSTLLFGRKFCCSKTSMLSSQDNN